MRSASPSASTSARSAETIGETSQVAIMLWPFLAMPMPAALPKPEPAPVMRIVLLMSFSFVGCMDRWLAKRRLEGGEAGPGDLGVLFDGAAGDAERAGESAVR